MCKNETKPWKKLSHFKSKSKWKNKYATMHGQSISNNFIIYILNSIHSIILLQSISNKYAANSK